MAATSLGLIVLFLWFQRDATATEVTGIIGGSVEMRCLYSGEEPFILNKFRVLWQKEILQMPWCFIDAYFPGEDMKPDQCEEFRNRTQLHEQLKKGNFSLRLLHINPKDELTYVCIVQRNRTGQFELFQKSSVTLKVAANYSEPVITQHVQSGEEIFICNSSHGYPLQKLKWINQTDNSLLNATEWHTEDSDGTFSVSSTLMIKATSDTKLGCRIENQRLHQNITTTFDTDNSANSSQIDVRSHTSHIVLGVVVSGIVLILIILYVRWNKRRPSLQRTYTDVCENEEGVHCNAPGEIENFQRC